MKNIALFISECNDIISFGINEMDIQHTIEYIEDDNYIDVQCIVYKHSSNIKIKTSVRTNINNIHCGQDITQQIAECVSREILELIKYELKRIGWFNEKLLYLL